MYDEQRGEYWSTRELHKILGYTEWRNFNSTVMKRAMKACEENGRAVSDHFVRSYKMVQLGSGSQRKTEDVFLSRYAAYLVVMNGDPNMPVVAMGQEYFAAQTRRQELSALPEEQKRLILRSEMAIFNAQLAEAAKGSGIIRSEDFASFQDHGYQGLYGGLRENDIHMCKSLTSEKQKIRCNMSPISRSSSTISTVFSLPGNVWAFPSLIRTKLLANQPVLSTLIDVLPGRNK